MKILISGAGIAGLTLAYWCKHYGFTPTIIEKHPFLRKGGYKVDVRGTAIEVAKKMGIYENLIDKNVNIQRSKFITPNLKVFQFDGDILGHSSEGDIEINRWDLAQILSKTLGDIEIIYNDSITKIDEEVINFEKAQPRKFDLVIGADGLYSNVRKIAFDEDFKFLKDYGIHFCIFPIPNIFKLDRCEIVYFNKGKLVSAYSVNDDSFACLAFKSRNEKFLRENLKDVFEEQFQNEGWEIPFLIEAMKESNMCYFDSIAQVRMPTWSKGPVALIGDAAHAASGIGTSLAMVGAYVLAREIGRSMGDYTIAFAKYEKTMRKFVEKGQDMAQSHLQLLANGDSYLVKCQLYLMKLLPEKFIQLFTRLGRRQMKKVANAIALD